MTSDDGRDAGQSGTGRPDLEVPNSTPRSNRSLIVTGRDVKFASIITFGAWVFGAYDYITFGTVLPAIADGFGWSTEYSTFIATLVSLLVFAAALTVGVMIDWLGRVKSLVVTIMGSAIGSILTGLSFAGWWLVLVRFFSGWGYAEQAVNSTYLNELYSATEDRRKRSRSRGRAYSYIQSGWPIGVLFGSAMAAILLPIIGWRGVFIVAGFPALVIIFMGRRLKESPQFERVKEVRRLARSGQEEEARKLSEEYGVPLPGARGGRERFPMLALFGPGQRRHTLFLCLGFLLNWFGVQTFQVLGTTVLLDAKGVKLENSLLLLIVANGVAVGGYIVHGYFGDRIGRREVVSIGWALSGISFTLMLFVVNGTVGVVVCYIAGLFFLIGPYAAFLFYMGESYPIYIRGSGTALINSMGPIGAIIGSALLTILLDAGYDMSVSATLVGALSIFLSGFLLLGGRRVHPGTFRDEGGV